MAGFFDVDCQAAGATPQAVAFSGNLRLPRIIALCNSTDYRHLG
jgi:hypothetical protein